MRRDRHSGRQASSNRVVRRASYQPDGQDDYKQRQYRLPTNENDQSLDQNFLPYPSPEYRENPWQAPFTAQPQEYSWQEEHPGSQFALPLDNAKPQHTGIWAGIAILSLIFIMFAMFLVFQAYQPYPLYLAKVQAMSPGTFFDGIVVDGLEVGGMSIPQAQAALTQGESAANPRLAIRLIVNDRAYQITNQEIPFDRNTPAVLEEAWSIGRQGFPWGIGAGKTPFEIRYLHALQTKKDKAYFSTIISYQPQNARALSESIAAQFNTEPINAVIETFNFATKQFSVTRDVPGQRLTADEVLSPLVNALDAGDYTAQIALHSTPILPKVSSVDLQNGFTQLSLFSTKTGSNEDRNFNIALAAQALNNQTLLPGEVFSFNKATGVRAIDKGYRGAPAIYGGVLIDDIGGGVCQVSSTLFNAAALAGLTIVDRSPHAWPSSYVEKGLDATVNWPNLDFKFRNDKDTPVFLISYYKKQTITVEIYGMRTAPGESISLETQLLKTTQAPKEPIMQPNPSLPPNTTQELKQARTGYEVDTYRVYMRNGNEYRREKLFSSNYKMVQQVIEYN